MWAQGLESRPQLRAPPAQNHHTVVTTWRPIELAGETGDFGDRPIANKQRLAHVPSMKEQGTDEQSFLLPDVAP